MSQIEEGPTVASCWSELRSLLTNTEPAGPGHRANPNKMFQSLTVALKCSREKQEKILLQIIGGRSTSSV